MTKPVHDNYNNLRPELSGRRNARITRHAVTNRSSVYYNNNNIQDVPSRRAYFSPTEKYFILEYKSQKGHCKKKFASSQTYQRKNNIMSKIKLTIVECCLLLAFNTIITNKLTILL